MFGTVCGAGASIEQPAGCIFPRETESQAYMRFLELGILLLIIGVVLSVLHVGALGGGLMYVGWICLVVGIILAVMHFLVGGRRRSVL